MCEAPELPFVFKKEMEILLYLTLQLNEVSVFLVERPKGAEQS